MQVTNHYIKQCARLIIAAPVLGLLHYKTTVKYPHTQCCYHCRYQTKSLRMPPVRWDGCPCGTALL